jgi:hypothetical protein
MPFPDIYQPSQFVGVTPLVVIFGVPTTPDVAVIVDALIGFGGFIAVTIPTSNASIKYLEVESGIKSKFKILPVTVAIFGRDKTKVFVPSPDKIVAPGAIPVPDICQPSISVGAAVFVVIIYSPAVPDAATTLKFAVIRPETVPELATDRTRLTVP